MPKRFLNQAYGLNSHDETLAFYSDWAESYDDEVQDNGYASPLRVAHALHAVGAKLNAPLLDIGCGTGVSGLFLKEAGFSDLDGSDFSPEMIARAKAKAIYQTLHLANIHEPFGFINREYQTLTAIGVFSPGHADASAMPDMVALLPKGGFFGLSLNDHALDDPSYLKAIRQLTMDRKLRVRWEDYGDHLPKINLNSLVMVLERL